MGCCFWWVGVYQFRGCGRECARGLMALYLRVREAFSVAGMAMTGGPGGFLSHCEEWGLSLHTLHV